MIRLAELCLTRGGFRLGPLSLQVAPAEYFVLLGPNGAGKTLLLQCLAGLLRPDAGAIHIDGRDVTGLEPRRRQVGYVPQDMGLFPHLNVEDNVTFGLRARGLSRSRARHEVQDLVDLLNLGPLLARRTAGLSGGERQRVALARALALRPHVLLLDEPVTAIDAAHRESLCLELRALQRRLHITTIHVTHNLREVLLVADRAGLLLDGRLAQTGPAEAIVHRPRNAAVARFLGCENILHAQAEPAPGGAVVHWAGHTLRCAIACQGEVTLAVRPDLLRLLPGDPPVDNAVCARLVSAIDRGEYRRLELDAGLPLVVYVTGDSPLAVGQSGQVYFPPDSLHVLETG